MFSAEWWTRAGYKTSGTFHLPSEEEVTSIIEASGGEVISITPLTNEE